MNGAGKTRSTEKNYGGSKMKDALAAIRRADDEREKEEVAALIAQLTPEETSRIIERMRALLNEQQEKQEVAG